MPSCAGPALPAGHGLRTIHRTPHARFRFRPETESRVGYSMPYRLRFRQSVVALMPRRDAASSRVVDSVSTRSMWRRSTSSTRARAGIHRPSRAPVRAAGRGDPRPGGRVARQDDCPLKDVHELAHVARPGVSEERAARRRREGEHAAPGENPAPTGKNVETVGEAARVKIARHTAKVGGKLVQGVRYHNGVNGHSTPLGTFPVTKGRWVAELSAEASAASAHALGFYLCLAWISTEGNSANTFAG